MQQQSGPECDVSAAIYTERLNSDGMIDRVLPRFVIRHFTRKFHRSEA